MMYNNPNDYWQGHNPYNGMNDDELMKAGCLQGAAFRDVLMTSQPFPIPNITGLSITFRNLYTYIDFGMPTIKSALDYMDVTGIPDEVVPSDE